MNPAKGTEQPIEFKAVNYIGMIPVLTEAIQEQNHNADELKKQNEMLVAENKMLKERMDKFEQALQSCCNNYSTEEKNSAQSTVKNGAQLLQNIPNPFNKKTVIKYYLPSDVASGVITIMASNGQEVRTFVISSTGAGQVEMDANALNAGTYTYQLTVNGKAVVSRQMIITK